MRHKAAIKIGVIFLGLCMTIILVNEFDRRKSMSKAIEFMHTVNEYMSDESFELALWNATGEPNVGGSDIFIKWWYNPSDDCYYFFVPKSFAERGMHWMFSEADCVTIDGMQIDNGSLCELAEGTYQINVERAEQTSQYNMAIRYSSDIASMF